MAGSRWAGSLENLPAGHHWFYALVCMVELFVFFLELVKVRAFFFPPTFPRQLFFLPP